MCKLNLPPLQNPFMPPILLGSLIILVRPYATKRNNKGAKGNPCLTPLSCLKRVDVSPLIINQKGEPSSQMA